MTYTIPAVKTIYNGIEMDSGLESGFAMWLDHHDVAERWEYHPPAVAGTWGRWRPDFALREVHVGWSLDPLDEVLVEVKPKGWPFDDPDAAMRLFRGLMHIPNALFVQAPGRMWWGGHEHPAGQVRCVEVGMFHAFAKDADCQPLDGKWWEGK